jgi:hypothetical protein
VQKSPRNTKEHFFNVLRNMRDGLGPHKKDFYMIPNDSAEAELRGLKWKISFNKTYINNYFWRVGVVHVKPSTSSIASLIMDAFSSCHSLTVL